MKNFSNFKKNLSSFISKLSFPSGFTLIELLIVIAVIGVLATLILASSTNATQKGRDAKRKSDLKQIQTALEMYRSDFELYPENALLSTCDIAFRYNSVSYMKKIPCDPLNQDENVYTYEQYSTNKSYKVNSCLENLNDPQGVTTDGPGPACTGKAFIVESQ